MRSKLQAGFDDLGVVSGCMKALVHVEEADAVPPIGKVLREHKEPAFRIEAAKALSHMKRGQLAATKTLIGVRAGGRHGGSGRFAAAPSACRGGIG